MKYLISACLIGENCKYDGKHNYHEIANKLYLEKLAYPVCPEELGGLPTPRVPSEINGKNVVNKEGEDVTREFIFGAEKTLQIARKLGVSIAILQARSPSCGSKQIYDGTFSNQLIDGEGVTTKLLREHGIRVITIDEYIKDYYETDFE